MQNGNDLIPRAYLVHIAYYFRGNCVCLCDITCFVVHQQIHHKNWYFFHFRSNSYPCNGLAMHLSKRLREI